MYEVLQALRTSKKSCLDYTTNPLHKQLYAPYIPVLFLQRKWREYGFTKEIVNDIQETIGASRYVSQQKLTEKVVELVNSGVAYNVEQRALYATISDRMVTTFDALDTTLASMIRVQQADLTGSQLGSEALLTKLFNSEFQDTS